jgi:hypothetical protein
MEQRQLRLGDILDDYCPRERRLTNHAIVAMIGAEVKQTRCTTCDAEHEYKHARVPRQRRKSDSPAALYSQVAAGAPKRVAHESGGPSSPENEEPPAPPADEPVSPHIAAPTLDSDERVTEPDDQSPDVEDEAENEEQPERDEGPVHRPLIRASLPRPEGQPPPQRPIPEFTIRQPGGRPGHFRARHARGGQGFQGNRGNGNIAGGPHRGGGHRQGSGRPPQGGGMRRHGQGGRKRSK